MEGEEKSGKGPAVKQENLGEKLKKRALLVGKRGGQNTPVLPPWRFIQQLPPPTGDIGGQYSITKVTPFPPPSARKLAATLWELHHYNLPFSKMYQGFNGLPPTLRRHQHPHHHDPLPSSSDPPGSTSSLKRHFAASLMQHHRSIQGNIHAIQPVSPASYDSSVEVEPYKPAVAPTSSIDFKGGNNETSFSLKTSTKLLKVLNGIWSLEEKHAANISLVKTLKKELDHARAKIKELVLDQQADHHDMDELMTQIAEEKLARKSKEQDRINAAIQSVTDELEDEKKLRKRLESLHIKLARELYEVKTSLANALKDLEKEKKSRKLLEDLCDEFAWKIRYYEHEVHALKLKSENNLADRGDHDRLILSISEVWLDERMQMKQESQSCLGEDRSVVDRLSTEIETYLQNKQNSNSRILDNLNSRDPTYHRNSLESTPLNVAVSTNQDECDEDDSVDSDSHCFELDKSGAVNLKQLADKAEESHIDARTKPEQGKNNVRFWERIKRRHPTSLQAKFEEKMAQAISYDAIRNQVEDTEQGEISGGQPVEINMLKKEIHEALEEGGERKIKAGAHETKSNNIDNLIRRHYLLSKSGNVQLESDSRVIPSGNSPLRGHTSPVRQWTAKLPSQDLDESESSSKLPMDIKENTLKEKLLEARSRGKKTCSHLKA